MPPLVQEKAATRDPKAKKTKSRNGCGRCKLKRLKCDETAPSCLQCKKRNIPCPGYEKTLKWSTKYEVFQPVQFEPSTVPETVFANPPKPPTWKEVTLPPDVVSGFEALAAVLPAGDKPQDSADRYRSSPNSQTDVVEEISASPQAGSPEWDTTPSGADSVSASSFELVDPLLLQDSFLEQTDSLPPDFYLETPDVFNLNHLDLDIEEIQRSQHDLSSLELSSPRLSRSLLLDYYRLPNPSPAAPLHDIESILIQHYFKDVCVLFSSFDSTLNPYRTTIGRLFNESASIYYGIQSMAAAHLANTFPNMAAIGVEMQRKACDSLQEELSLVQNNQKNSGRTFLSIILLGLTACWHESSSLGEEFLTTARSLILPKLLGGTEDEEAQRQNQFFEESLIYWEMLMGFVTQDAMSFSPGPGLRSRALPAKRTPATRKSDGKIVPHPWTGIAPTVQILFAEVGRLVRRERMMHHNVTVDMSEKQETLRIAGMLEEDLLSAEYPMADELADPGDERTSKRHFIAIAEAYRCVGLLELYRIFPSILRKRLETDKFTWTDNIEFEFPTPRFDTPYEDTDTKLWLNSLALHILSTLESLPSSSGTCCLQPILLVAAASELKFVSSLDYFDIYANDAKVRHARDFAARRLHEYSLRLPAKPLRTMIELVREVWRRFDDGQDAFWVDVMVEKGWHTVMG